MKISLDQSDGIYTIHSYRDETLFIRPPNAAPEDEEMLLQLNHSCLISAGQLIEEWPPQEMSALTAEHLQAVADMAPELLLVGSGSRLQFPSGEQLAALVKLGIGYEVMDTAAACRTYNVLISEGRKVVAALFPA